MIGRDTRLLNAAGIRDPEIRAAYTRCRRLHARHGRTYYLATLLLAEWKRPYVHALYGFARYADEIVDNEDPRTREAHFRQWSATVLDQLNAGAVTDPVCLALADTMSTWQIPLAHIEAFLDSMAADLTVTRYPTFEDLAGYMYGSAAVIGLQMLPILEPLTAEASIRAEALGQAFQLTNFLRDIGEDLRRSRVYLPMEDLDRFGVTPDDLNRPPASPAVRDLIAFEIDRTRRIYAFAAGGIPMLHPTSRPCIEAAYTLYSGILDMIESTDYQILHRRVSVPNTIRARVGLRCYLQARRERDADLTGQPGRSSPKRMGGRA